MFPIMSSKHASIEVASNVCQAIAFHVVDTHVPHPFME